jgi:hypothetical protein
MAYKLKVYGEKSKLAKSEGYRYEILRNKKSIFHSNLYPTKKEAEYYGEGHKLEYESGEK